MNSKYGFICGVLCLTLSLPILAAPKNGFDLSDSNIPVSQILQGGPPRDGIPAIDQPKFIQASDAVYLHEDDRVLGLNINGEARAYPIRILNWHEIVNDQIAGQAVVISYCPLCGTGMAFDAKVQGRNLSFGVSGLLYQSDVLLYDRKTDSLWSQIKREAVTGKLKGQRLTQLALAHTSWKDWRDRYPDTQVLSQNTGFNRDYSYSPYGGYDTSPRLYFDVNHRAPAIYHPKEQVLGVVINGESKAYPFTELSKTGVKSFQDQLGEHKFVVIWNEQARSAYILDTDQQEIPTTIAFWFAWYAFHPDTGLFTASKN